MRALVKKVTSYKFRAWFYGLAAASVPVAISQGWLEPEAAAYILPLLVALLKVTPEEAPVAELPDVEV